MDLLNDSAMVIISHRGYWEREEEKNTECAFVRAFSSGFGVETDIRDYKGELIVSHDIPDGDCMSVDELFEIYNRMDARHTLALNIKSDGLQNKLKSLLDKHKISNYFVFDMSIPETARYIAQKFNVFARHSEYEKDICFYAESKGVWLDEFCSHWITDSVIEEHVAKGKSVCLVSPELHNRGYEKEWSQYKKLGKKVGDKKLILCTDFPEKAREFFSE